MDETMGPFYYDCPLEYLALAPETNPAWRAKVLAHHGVAAVPPVTAELFA
jgi:hypothetical protein